MITRILTVILFASTTFLAQAPAADHHQHLFSPTIAELGKVPPITAKDVIALLDEAGIKRGVLLSIAYMYGRPGREPQNEYERVKEENDWVGSQAALYPKRLIAFCGFNPLKDYALDEIARCAKNPMTRRGIKLHFGNSDVQLENPEHLEKLKAVFRAANSNRMAIVVHMRASISLNRPYGAEQARVFVEQLLPLTTDVPVQIAHLAGSGPGFNDAGQDSALDAWVAAIQNPKSKIQNRVWFDLTTSAHPSNSPERTALLLKRIRQLGVKRILYGSDAAVATNLRPKESWAEVTKIGLTPEELKTIATNRPQYLR